MSARDRLEILRSAVREYPGPWTTSTVQALYRSAGLAAPRWETAQDDLDRLTRQGLLLCHSVQKRRFYWLNTWQGAVS